MLELHRVLIATSNAVEEVLVLATSPKAACAAASIQCGRGQGTVYLGRSEAVVLSDVPWADPAWQTTEAVDVCGNYGGS